MDDWLGRGGPLGAILGFAIGGLVLLPVAYVYVNGSNDCRMRPAKLPTPRKYFHRSSAISPAG